MKLAFALLLSTTLALSANAETICTRTQVCTPPATYVIPTNPAPFNAAMKFAGEVTVNGETRWQWALQGPAPACTPQRASDRNAYQVACALLPGAVMYTTPRIKL